MNANKQDAGGLPALPSPIGWYRAWLPSGEPVDEFMPGANRPDDWPVTDCAPMWSRRAMRAYGELCRDATAGGDVDSQRRLHADIIEWEQRVDAGEISARELWSQVRPSLNALRKLIRDSAPAGSGEVEAMLDELILSAMNDRDELLGWEASEDTKQLRAALLRKLQQGADYVLVPRESLRTEARRLRYRAAECWPTFSTGTDAGAQMIGTAEALEQFASQGQEGGHAGG